MSLRLICGRAGTGKSEFCYEEIKNNINNVVIIAYLLCYFPYFFSACGIFYLADRLEKIREGACAAASKNVDKHAQVCKK